MIIVGPFKLRYSILLNPIKPLLILITAIWAKSFKYYSSDV